jgi:hypothetical protein
MCCLFHPCQCYNFIAYKYFYVSVWQPWALHKNGGRMIYKRPNQPISMQIGKKIKTLGLAALLTVVVNTSALPVIEFTRDPIPEDRILETVPLYVIPKVLDVVIGDAANYLAKVHKDKHCHLMKQLFLQWNEADAELKYMLLSLSTNKDCTKYLSTK